MEVESEREKKMNKKFNFSVARVQIISSTMANERFQWILNDA